MVSTSQKNLLGCSKCNAVTWVARPMLFMIWGQEQNSVRITVLVHFKGQGHFNFAKLGGKKILPVGATL